MAAHFLAENRVDHFFELLRQQGDIHGSVRGDDGVVRFAALPPAALPDFAALRTLLPPKKYLLHPCEAILNYTTDAGYQQSAEEIRPLILFGLHPCDLAGINYLDRLFLEGDPDPLYAARRAAMTLIGLSCTPDENCSCHRLHSPLLAVSDLFLHSVEGGAVISIGTPRGDKLLESLQEILTEWHGDVPEDARRYFGQRAPKEALPVVDATLPEWQQFAGKCLGCGACSLCCPTCTCFDVLEFGGLDGRSAVRVRQWDNCLFKSHGQVSGGMNFRKDRAERFRYRYRHKYRGFGLLQQIPSCVGCGRCRVVCPVGIDLRPLAEQLEGGAP